MSLRISFQLLTSNWSNVSPYFPGAPYTFYENGCLMRGPFPWFEAQSLLQQLRLLSNWNIPHLLPLSSQEPFQMEEDSSQYFLSFTCPNQSLLEEEPQLLHLSFGNPNTVLPKRISKKADTILLTALCLELVGKTVDLSTSLYFYPKKEEIYFYGYETVQSLKVKLLPGILNNSLWRRLFLPSIPMTVTYFYFIANTNYPGSRDLYQTLGRYCLPFQASVNTNVVPPYLGRLGSSQEGKFRSIRTEIKFEDCLKYLQNLIRSGYSNSLDQKKIEQEVKNCLCYTYHLIRKEKELMGKLLLFLTKICLRDISLANPNLCLEIFSLKVKFHYSSLYPSLSHLYTLVCLMVQSPKCILLPKLQNYFFSDGDQEGEKNFHEQSWLECLKRKSDHTFRAIATSVKNLKIQERDEYLRGIWLGLRPLFQEGGQREVWELLYHLRGPCLSERELILLFILSSLIFNQPLQIKPFSYDPNSSPLESSDSFLPEISFLRRKIPMQNISPQFEPLYKKYHSVFSS